MSRNATIYARYSPGPNQTESSIEGQLKVIREYAERNNYNIVGEPYIDRAKSGKTTSKRTQFQQMIEDGKKRHFDVVLVYALDRFGRNLYESIDNEHKLLKNGVVLISATEENQNTPSGRLQRNIMLSFAQYYTDELSEKVKRGISVSADEA